MKITAAARTHIGRRKNNEDAFLVEPELGLFVVADGMGGYEGGEVASRLVVETLQAFFRNNAEDADLTWPLALDRRLGFVANELNTGVMLAHREVLRHRKGRLRNMGATLVAIAIDVDRAIIAHLGDSRVYRLRGEKLERLTRDHSYAEMMNAAGGCMPPGYGHVVTRAVGRPEEGPPELAQTRLSPGDVIMLCSDGISDVLDDAEIAEILGASDDPDLIATALVNEAYVAGGQDNITAVVMRVG